MTSFAGLPTPPVRGRVTAGGYGYSSTMLFVWVGACAHNVSFRELALVQRLGSLKLRRLSLQVTACN